MGMVCVCGWYGLGVCMLYMTYECMCICTYISHFRTIPMGLCSGQCAQQREWWALQPAPAVQLPHPASTHYLPLHPSPTGSINAGQVHVGTSSTLKRLWVFSSI